MRDRRPVPGQPRLRALDDLRGAPGATDQATAARPHRRARAPAPGAPLRWRRPVRAARAADGRARDAAGLSTLAAPARRTTLRCSRTSGKAGCFRTSASMRVRFEEKAQEYFANPWTRSVVNCDHRPRPFARRARAPRGGRVPGPVVHVQLDRQRDPLEPFDARCSSTSIRERSTWTAGDLERRISAATRAIVVTHIFGSPLPSPRVWRWRARRRAPGRRGRRPRLRRDATRERRDRRPAALGDFQVFSFSGTKQTHLAPKAGWLPRPTAAGREDRISAGLRLPERLRFAGSWASTGSCRRSTPPWPAWPLGASTRPSRRVSAKAARYRDAPRSRCRAFDSRSILPECSPTYKDFAILCPERRDDLAASSAKRRHPDEEVLPAASPNAGLPALSVAGRTISATRSPSRMPSCVCRCSTSWPTPTSTG